MVVLRKIPTSDNRSTKACSTLAATMSASGVTGAGGAGLQGVLGRLDGNGRGVWKLTPGHLSVEFFTVYSCPFGV
jgi:hypothetical protein